MRRESPAPLVVRLGWGGFAGVRHSLLQIFRVVTAFAIGHSITLALAALRLMRVVSRPIEMLIAVSIPFSAINAVRALFPGRTKLYAGAKVKSLDMEKIVYFAASVFWRGAVHQWTSSLRSEAPDVHLCAYEKYEKPVRQFLLGTSPFPDDVALTVFVCPNGSVLNAMLVPREAHLPEE